MIARTSGEQSVVKRGKWKDTAKRKKVVKKCKKTCDKCPTTPCPGDTIPNGNGNCVCPGSTIDYGNGNCKCPGDTVIDGVGDCSCPGDTVNNGLGTCSCPENTMDDGNGNCSTASKVLITTGSSCTPVYSHSLGFKHFVFCKYFGLVLGLVFPTGRDSETFRDNGIEVPSLSRDKGTN